MYVVTEMVGGSQRATENVNNKPSYLFYRGRNLKKVMPPANSTIVQDNDLIAFLDRSLAGTQRYTFVRKVFGGNT